jgi:lysine 2,3-aminomutase
VRFQVTPHVRRKIASGSVAIARQFQVTDGDLGLQTGDDPLGEESRFSPVKGIVHKFDNRVLWKLTYRCAAHCRFCTRIRQIGSSSGDLSKADIDAALEYIRSHSEITDVILSGGDPMYVPQDAVRALKGLASIETVRVVRIGTRLPIHSPSSFKTAPILRVLETLRDNKDRQQPYILLHVNHPDEIDDEVIAALRSIQAHGLSVLSQTVLLRDINDDVAVLERLFSCLYQVGVIPYYIYRCDRVAGLERFMCELERERAIVTELHRRLAGIAVPRYVVDVAGRGKIPVPLSFWQVSDLSSCVDFDGAEISIS